MDRCRCGQGAQQRVACADVAVGENQQSAVGQLGDGFGQLHPAGGGAGAAAPSGAGSGSGAPAAGCGTAAAASAAGAFLGSQRALNFDQPDGFQKGERLAHCQRCGGLGLGRRNALPVGFHQIGGAGFLADALRLAGDQKGIAIDYVRRHDCILA